MIEHPGGQPPDVASGAADPAHDSTFYARPAAVHGWRRHHLPFTNVGDAPKFRAKLRQLLHALYIPANRQLRATYTAVDTLLVKTLGATHP